MTQIFHGVGKNNPDIYVRGTSKGWEFVIFGSRVYSCCKYKNKDLKYKNKICCFFEPTLFAGNLMHFQRN